MAVTLSCVSVVDIIVVDIIVVLLSFQVPAQISAQEKRASAGCQLVIC